MNLKNLNWLLERISRKYIRFRCHVFSKNQCYFWLSIKKSYDDSIYRHFRLLITNQKKNRLACDRLAYCKEHILIYQHYCRYICKYLCIFYSAEKSQILCLALPSCVLTLWLVSVIYLDFPIGNCRLKMTEGKRTVSFLSTISHRFLLQPPSAAKMFFYSLKIIC